MKRQALRALAADAGQLFQFINEPGHRLGKLGHGRSVLSSQFSVSFRERVLEIVGVLSVRDIDVHFSGKSCELAGTGVGYNGDRQMERATIHRAAMLEDKATAAAAEASGDALDGHVGTRALDTGASTQHHAPAGAFEIAME